MSHYRRAHVPGGTYFFTVVTERRQPILIHADVRLALREAIVLVRETLPFRIDGWVLLPDHLHALWTLPEGDADFSTRWRLIKRHVTRTCGPAYTRPDHLTERRAAKHCGTLWQHRFWEHLIRDERDFRHHLDYLHGNPLKHGLVERVADWPWSSFHRWARQGAYPADWAGAGNDGLVAEG
ncbi:REP-associated tyrosine transposase [Azotobacter beijerinckii]|uniref:Transposase n=1 Tax=Azotobacter beijerinckii TaxID=170623 RepID=A0A1I4GLQ4_9GAMM|nr:transposase [Azotobacter beijerinckii]SFB64255.1 putative transposase [Azotobacter beijerinckii]SFL31004.1 putative transposase [Azotobacter beijerinckii]